MLKTKNNIHIVIFKYFLIFSFTLLGLLWVFQILFFRSFYRIQKINDVKTVASEMKKIENSVNFGEEINRLVLIKGFVLK